MDFMNVSTRLPMLHPDQVEKSLLRSGWNLYNTRRSISTGGSYAVWVHENENGKGFATTPINAEYISRFAEETLSAIAKHYGYTQQRIYDLISKGLAIE